MAEARRKAKKVRNNHPAKQAPLNVAAAGEPVAETEEFLALTRMLTRAKGFTLGFARVNLPAQRREIAARAREAVAAEGVRVVEIEFKGPVSDLLGVLSRRLEVANVIRVSESDGTIQVEPVEERVAVFVSGIEHSIPSAALYHPMLAVMNLKRELFPKNVPFPLILWLPEYALQAVAEGAPDFWAWRSGVYEFTSPRSDVERQWQHHAPDSDPYAYDELPREDKHERIQILSALLAEYSAREEAESPEIAYIRGDLLYRLGNLHRFLGNWREALNDYERASALFSRIQSVSGVAASLHAIGIIHQQRGDYDTALDYFRRSLEIKQKIGNRKGVAVALHHIGIIHTERGEYDKALDYYRRSLQIHQEIGNKAGVARSFHHIGIIHLLSGDFTTALAFFQQSIEIKQDIGDRAGIAGSLHHIAIVNQERGDYDTALDFFQQSFQMQQEIGNRAGVASTRGQMGRLLAETGRFTEAFASLIHAWKAFKELGSPNILLAVADLLKLRETWGAGAFDRAWQEETGEPVPEWLTEPVEAR